ncbi:homogentisate 1,2-dioxygenase [Geosmithia morbida]|uniref:homogentisate 1,2-dioxygenase n=1 Tax=Geosmithia morbida TaxID=1094350 RepID=A0A9P5D1V9_9HYPO|nr:homogentisate 1,2-dioxygenase [Geosmithia morbida]KAF4120871.1 homogentisate 1,2-dioxygenase [Geosmithia morbida]
MVHFKASSGYTTQPTVHDPYSYQTGFGNRFESEAVPNVLPRGRNAPQKVKYDLYSEQLNGSSFVATRQMIQNVWMYRILPSVAHNEISSKPDMNPDIESCFSSANSKVEFIASQQAWGPFPLSKGESGSTGTDFVEGIKTVGGNGDPTLREGLAIHIYSANKSMENRAFCNSDGDFLILPQHGRLNIQTELGWMMVRPGELAVIQAGLRFRVQLPDGAVRGYVQEIFGAHYELPELGPVGSNGMALPRDFESPLASFDVDNSTWEIVYKVAGGLHSCKQDHTPFDVVAWHGNLVPYKYAIEKFVNMANVEKDQADPTIYCVLTARSKIPGVSASDFLVFTPKWISTSDTFRPPYYHRNMSTEMMGLIYGRYGGSSHALEPGGLSYEASYLPHGETHETWLDATTKDLTPTRICEDTIAFMFHISVPMFLTNWALKGKGSESLNLSSVNQWDGVKAHFIQHLDHVNSDLIAAGLPALPAEQKPNKNGTGRVNGHEKGYSRTEET